MPVRTAPKLGVRAFASLMMPSATRMLVMPAVRENSVDQAKPMMTSDSDRIDRSATSQSTCTFRPMRVSM
ncbi:hypothetical protein D3C71_1905760 [compost metagenome]